MGGAGSGSIRWMYDGDERLSEEEEQEEQASHGQPQRHSRSARAEQAQPLRVLRQAFEEADENGGVA